MLLFVETIIERIFEMNMILPFLKILEIRQEYLLSYIFSNQKFKITIIIENNIVPNFTSWIELIALLAKSLAKNDVWDLAIISRQTAKGWQVPLSKTWSFFDFCQIDGNSYGRSPLPFSKNWLVFVSTMTRAWVRHPYHYKLNCFMPLFIKSKPLLQLHPAMFIFVIRGSQQTFGANRSFGLSSESSSQQIAFWEWKLKCSFSSQPTPPVTRIISSVRFLCCAWV